MNLSSFVLFWKSLAMSNEKGPIKCILKLFKLEGKYLNQENHRNESSDQKVEFIGELAKK